MKQNEQKNDIINIISIMNNIFFYTIEHIVSLFSNYPNIAIHETEVTTANPHTAVVDQSESSIQKAI